MRRILVAAGGGLAVLSTPAGAEGPDTPPDWIRRPTSQDLMSVWPAKALRQGVGGRAVLSCVVTVQGTLRECAVVEEDPPDAGFGSAALALTSQLLMKPARKDGAPVASTVRIPINFPRPERATGSHLRPATDTDFRGTRVYTRLPWRQAPTYAEVVAAYPEKARTAKLGGAVTLDCQITKAGGLSGCDVLREEPKGQGFGAAARKLAARFVGPDRDNKGELLWPAHTHLTIAFDPSMLDGGMPVVGKPQWTALPAMDDFTKVIPAAARKARVYKARVVLSCRVGQAGALEGCEGYSEEPGGLGYKDAALALSGFFRLAVWTDEGLPSVGGQVRVPIRFDLEEAMAENPVP